MVSWMKGASGASSKKAFGVGIHVDQSLAGQCPSDVRAFIRLPNHGVADAGAEHVRVKSFKVVHRVFEGSSRVAGIDRCADEFRPGLFDKSRKFPALHIARMIFDGDFHPLNQEQGFHCGKNFERVLVARHDASGRAAILGKFLVAAGDRGAEFACDI